LGNHISPWASQSVSAASRRANPKRTLIRYMNLKNRCGTTPTALGQSPSLHDAAAGRSTMRGALVETGFGAAASCGTASMSAIRTPVHSSATARMAPTIPPPTMAISTLSLMRPTPGVRRTRGDFLQSAVKTQSAGALNNTRPRCARRCSKNALGCAATVG